MTTHLHIYCILWTGTKDKHSFDPLVVNCIQCLKIAQRDSTYRDEILIEIKKRYLNLTYNKDFDELIKGE